jgi:hypothetical protein
MQVDVVDDPRTTITHCEIYTSIPLIHHNKSTFGLLMPDKPPSKPGTRNIHSLDSTIYQAPIRTLYRKRFSSCSLQYTV